MEILLKLNDIFQKKSFLQNGVSIFLQVVIEITYGFQENAYGDSKEKIFRRF